MSNMRAIGLILSAMLWFAIQDVIVKFTAEDVSLWQMQVIRSISIIVLVTALLTFLGRPSEITPVRWRWPFVRGLFMSVAYLGFYASLPYISLAKAASAFFISPMLITLLAAIFLGEGIGPRRIAAVLVGFIGVLFIVQPGLEGWNPYALLPVAAAFAYASGIVLTRWRCQNDPGFSLTMVNAWINGAVGGIAVLLLPFMDVPPEMQAEHSFVLSGWQPLTPLLLALIVATAVTHLAGALSAIKAYQIGEASRLAPFEYSYLVVMAVFGYAIWGTVPEDATLIGMALIFAAGGFIAWREGRPPRPRVQQNAEIPWTPEHLDEDPSCPPPEPSPPASIEPARRRPPSPITIASPEGWPSG